MCGIFGSFARDGAPPDTARLAAMSASIAHRGPDADGTHLSGNAAIGNRRLALIDLTPASNQPMLSDDGRIAVVQNGEIFNYVELRDDLRRAGARFRTTGDTEVILRAFEHWGPDFARRLNGMFAIAVHDARDGTLWLWRDRLGVKPLYLAERGGTILFASEIKALIRAGLPARPDMGALAQYLALNYVPAPATAFDGIRHLPPGHMARITRDGITETAWWRLPGTRPDPAMDMGQAQAGLLSILDDATRIRLRSDAAFGAFLSGGLDSSAVTGLMSLYLPDAVRSFSIGFDDPRYDETPFARQAARRFGTLHVTGTADADIAALWPRFIWHVDQPHGDASFMPMDMVSRLAARDVKMVLTGDGGDELWGGYDKYLAFFPGGRSDHLAGDWPDAFARDAGLLSDPSLLAGDLAAAWAAADPRAALSDAIRAADGQDPVNAVLMAETLVLLPGNNLVKPDRMAMANSLEVRSPFLDYRMAEFAMTVPGHLKLAGGQSKAVAKGALLPLLGRDLVHRRKQMFTVPVGDWFRQALAGYCRGLLLDGRFAARGLADPVAVAALVESHINGRQNQTRLIRALISLELWFRLFIDADPDTLAQAGA
jgi:asparagine synthase (glutamine-hydrolysing)